jgi:hypothetical protein
MIDLFLGDIHITDTSPETLSFSYLDEHEMDKLAPEAKFSRFSASEVFFLKFIEL